MRSEPEILDLILQTAKVLQVNAVAMSGSRTNPNAPRDEFQDYDVVYIVEDLDGLVADLAWLERFGSASSSSIMYLTIATSISCSLKMAIGSI